MKNLRIVLLCLFGFIAIVTLIILIVYLKTFNKGVSANVSNWDLFLNFYNGIVITFLTIANIWVFYKLTVAIENRNETRRIKEKLNDTQKVLIELRVQEYKNLKTEINNFFVDSFFKKNFTQDKEAILSILMRMQNSVLFCCSNNQSKSVLDVPIALITENLIENMKESNYDKINKAMRLIEKLIIIPLFNENSTLEYIRKYKDGIDPTILGIDNYLKDKINGCLRI